MPVNDGIVYSTVANGVKIGIGWYELANLMGCVQDEGMICTSPNINVWSKIKPQALLPQFDIPGEIPMSSRDTNTAYKYGLEHTELTNQAGLLGSIQNMVYVNGWGVWKYHRPENWYRATDFDGYDHYAACPFGYLPEEGGTIILPDRGNNTIPADIPLFFEVSRNFNGVPTGILNSDLQFIDGTRFSDAYYGMVVVISRGAGQQYYFFFCSENKGLNSKFQVRLSAETISAILNNDNLTSVTGVCYLFASNYKFSTNNLGQSIINEPVTARYIPLNQKYGKTLTLARFGSNGVGGAMAVRAWRFGGIIRYQLGFINYSNSSMYFQGVTSNPSHQNEIRVILSSSNSSSGEIAASEKWIVPRTIPANSTIWTDEESFGAYPTAKYVLVGDVYAGGAGNEIRGTGTMIVEQPPIQPPTYVE